MKALLQYRASGGFRRSLEEVAPEWLRVEIVDETALDVFAREMRDTHVLLHVLEPVTAEVMANAPELGLIHKIGVGTNTIDLEAARARNVAVCNMPGTNTQAVAELSLALMLAALRRVPFFDAETRAGRGWTPDLDALDSLGELSGRTVGLVGFGAVARRLAPVLSALGARVRYWTREPKPDADAEWVSLEELLAESDVISLHVPLVSETERLLDADAFSRLKRGCVLVNTARGGLVDEPALIAALESGAVRAAGLDVFAYEPIDPSSALLELPNVVVSPHLAWLTPETLSRSVGVAFENCRRLRDGEPLLHRVV